MQEQGEREVVPSVWREGTTAVCAREGALLPDRCVVCNSAAEGYRRHQKLSWHPPSLYGVLLAGPLFYALAARSTREHAVIDLPLCVRHRKRGNLGIALGWLGTALSVSGLLVSAWLPSTPLAIGSGLLLVLSLAAGMALARTARCVQIDETTVRLRVGASFLESLPDPPLVRPPAAEVIPSWQAEAPRQPEGPDPAEALLAQLAPGAGIEGFQVHVTARAFIDVPPCCAGCAGPIAVVLPLRPANGRYPGPSLRVGYCHGCAARLTRETQPLIVLGALLATIAVLSPAAAYWLDLPSPAVVLVAPTLVVAALSLALFFALRPRRAGEPNAKGVALLKTLRASAEDATLFCANGKWAAGLAARNGFALEARSKPLPFRHGAGIAGVAVCAALTLSIAVWDRQWPKVVVDNAGPFALAIWVDGEVAGEVPPNVSGLDPSSMRIRLGAHDLGYSAIGAPRPSREIIADVRGGSRHLYNPGTLACHWRDVMVYATSSRRYVDPNATDQVGPLKRQEFYDVDRIDYWLESAPSEIQTKQSQETRTMVLREPMCTRLAQQGCDGEVLDELVRCEYFSSDQDGMVECARRAVEACGTPALSL